VTGTTALVSREGRPPLEAEAIARPTAICTPTAHGPCEPIGNHAWFDGRPPKAMFEPAPETSDDSTFLPERYPVLVGRDS
jgi:hypothetical protein